VAWRNLGVPLV